jgi:signal transduction histidine kinase
MASNDNSAFDAMQAFKEAQRNIPQDVVVKGRAAGFTGSDCQQLTAALNNLFLSTMSHQLRTPLNLIGGLSEILLKESDESAVPLPARYRTDVERIHASAQHLGS